ncbi:MAG: nitroreductase family protein [Pararhizobium sp.]
MSVDAHLKSFMETRRSIPVLQLGEPGPDRAAIEEMLRIAARVPDHGKLAPWRFVVFRGDERLRIGEKLLALAERKTPELTESAREIERMRLARAPVVVMIVSRAAPHPKIPEWEQVLSAGAAGMNLLIAASALGFSAAWITEWIAYDAEAKAILGVKADEKIAGFVNIGTPQQPPFERARPELAEVVSWVGGDD